VNSIGLTVKQVRVFINDPVRRKIIPSIDMHDFKVTNEETDAIYLTYALIAANSQMSVLTFISHCLFSRLF